jgi:hypothetical protein
VPANAIVEVLREDDLVVVDRIIFHDREIKIGDVVEAGSLEQLQTGAVVQIEIHLTTSKVVLILGKGAALELAELSASNLRPFELGGAAASLCPQGSFAN